MPDDYEGLLRQSRYVPGSTLLNGLNQDQIDPLESYSGPDTSRDSTSGGATSTDSGSRAGDRSYPIDDGPVEPGTTPQAPNDPTRVNESALQSALSQLANAPAQVGSVPSSGLVTTSAENPIYKAPAPAPLPANLYESGLNQANAPADWNTEFTYEYPGGAGVMPKYGGGTLLNPDGTQEKNWDVNPLWTQQFEGFSQQEAPTGLPSSPVDRYTTAQPGQEATGPGVGAPPAPGAGTPDLGNLPPPPPGEYGTTEERTPENTGAPRQGATDYYGMTDLPNWVVEPSQEEIDDLYYQRYGTRPTAGGRAPGDGSDPRAGGGLLLEGDSGTSGAAGQAGTEGAPNGPSTGLPDLQSLLSGLGGQAPSGAGGDWNNQLNELLSSYWTRNDQGDEAGPGILPGGPEWMPKEVQDLMPSQSEYYQSPDYMPPVNSEGMMDLINKLATGQGYEDLAQVQGSKFTEALGNRATASKGELAERLAGSGLTGSQLSNQLAALDRQYALGGSQGLQSIRENALNQGIQGRNTALGALQGLEGMRTEAGLKGRELFNNYALGMGNLGLGRENLAQKSWQDQINAILTGRGQDIEESLGREGIQTDRLRDQINAILGGRGLDIQENLGIGNIETQRLGDQINAILEGRGQDVQYALGQGGLSNDLLRILSGNEQYGTGQETERRGQDMDYMLRMFEMLQSGDQWEREYAAGVLSNMGGGAQ